MIHWLWLIPAIIVSIGVGMGLNERSHWYKDELPDWDDSDMSLTYYRNKGDAGLFKEG
jgi:hypothetical protein